MNMDVRLIPIIQAAGVYGLARVSSLQLDWSLIRALVERWRPETHSFHLPIGECTITLQDVGVLIGLPIDGHPVMCPSSPPPGQTWMSTIGQIFGQVPPPNVFNNARIRLTWFEGLTPPVLRDDAGVEEVRLLARCYLIQLLGGSMFTDNSGGAIHSMWVHFLRDLDAFGGYAWGPAVLARLYRELDKGCRAGTTGVAGCLTLLQLWAWERLPTLAPVRTTVPLVDVAFWQDQLQGPHGVRWLVGHSYLECDGRTVGTARMALDGLAPGQFIWEPYVGIIDTLPDYCLAGRPLWRYRGPMVCVYIVEPHQPDRVARQFGMIQRIPDQPHYSAEHHAMTLKGQKLLDYAVTHQPSMALWHHRLEHIFTDDLIDGHDTVPEYMDWYLPRTVRFVSHLGALLIGLGVSLQAIADGTRHLPDMHQIATQSLQAIRDRHAYVFHQLLVEEHEAVHDEDEEDAGDRGGRAGGERGRGGGRRGRGAGRGARDAARGGRARGRGGRARGRGGRGGGRLVDEPVDDADHADEQDHVDTGEDGGPESSTAAAATVGESFAAAAAAATATATPPVAAAAATATTTGAGDWWPSFSLGLSLPSQPVPEQQTSLMPDTSTEQPPPVVQRQHRIRPWHGTPEVPPFDLGSSSQSTQSTQPSQPATQPSLAPFDVFYVRRSKRDRKAPDCGTGSHRG
ncbi:serine/threonine-protein phosphatase 7 long form homolog [Daucus carota subsp. sativus]|uniref:serine/threonine-protein phosphatase 7 long form homolog n=1 Tax=Daucus carota subsp. sativus TaxID=79200 RepID=UPI003082905D